MKVAKSCVYKQTSPFKRYFFENQSENRNTKVFSSIFLYIFRSQREEKKWRKIKNTFYKKPKKVAESFTWKLKKLQKLALKTEKSCKKLHYKIMQIVPYMLYIRFVVIYKAFWICKKKLQKLQKLALIIRL